MTVIAIQTETGFRREAVTDETGSYALLNLPIGPYRLEATLAGFRTYSQTGVVLQVNSNPVIPVTMQLGSLEETVSVEASAPLVETRNPAIGAIIDNEAVEALPLEGRNPVMLIMMAGAAADTGAPAQPQHDHEPRHRDYRRPAVWRRLSARRRACTTTCYDGLNLPLPFPDALQEFRVETSSQNAQNGRAGQRHGQPGDQVRHQPVPRRPVRVLRVITASTPPARSPASIRRPASAAVTAWCATSSAARWAGRSPRIALFFFGAYQGTRATQTPADIVTFIPTAAMLAGDFFFHVAKARRALEHDRKTVDRYIPSDRFVAGERHGSAAAVRAIAGDVDHLTDRFDLNLSEQPQAEVDRAGNGGPAHASQRASGKPVGELVGAPGVVDHGPGDHDVLFGFSRPFDIRDDDSTDGARPDRVMNQRGPKSLHKSLSLQFLLFRVHGTRHVHRENEREVDFRPLDRRQRGGRDCQRRGEPD